MMTRTHSIPVHMPARHRRSGFLTWLTALNALFRARKSLAEMDAHMLDDIGVTPEQARKEANRPLWDVPGHWTR